MVIVVMVMWWWWWYWRWLDNNEHYDDEHEDGQCLDALRKIKFRQIGTKHIRLFQWLFQVDDIFSHLSFCMRNQPIPEDDPPQKKQAFISGCWWLTLPNLLWLWLSMEVTRWKSCRPMADTAVKDDADWQIDLAQSLVPALRRQQVAITVPRSQSTVQSQRNKDPNCNKSGAWANPAEHEARLQPSCFFFFGCKKKQK